MDKVIPFACPECDHGILKSASEPRPDGDLPDTICSNCGHAITEDEIRAQALEIMDAEIRKIKF
jgi:DNA-directed RNA polymerase subunit RPC12/RpoP